MNLTPEQIESLGKVTVQIVGAIGAVIATVVSGVVAYWTYRTRQDTHFLGDKIREVNGEPLQYRYDPDRRNVAIAEADKAAKPEGANGQ